MVAGGSYKFISGTQLGKLYYTLLQDLFLSLWHSGRENASLSKWLQVMSGTEKQFHCHSLGLIGCF